MNSLRRSGVFAFVVGLWLIPVASARQGCEPVSHAQLAPAVNPVALSQPGEVQWFTLPVPGGHVYDVSFSMPWGAGSVLTNVFGNDCARPLSGSYVHSSFSYIVTVPVSENRLLIRVETRPGLIEPVTATFQVTDRGPTADDLPSNAAWARVLEPDGVWVDGAIDHEFDSDFYRVPTVPEMLYRIERRGLPVTTADTTFRLDHDDTGVWLLQSNGTSAAFSVAGQSGSTHAAYQVRALAVTTPLSADQPGVCTEAGTTAIGETIRGETAPGDIDWFAWPVVAGHRYRVTQLSSRWFGPRLYWNTCDTPVISTRFVGGAQEFTTDRAGTVLAQVDVASATETQPYELRIDDIGAVPQEEPNQLADARPLVADGELYHGVLESGADTDVFRVAVDPGWLYEITVRGAAGAALIDPARYADQRLVGAYTQGPDGLSTSVIRLLMPQDGSDSRWIVLSNSSLQAPGAYSLSVRRAELVGDADLSDDPSAPTPITTIDAPIDFHISRSWDADWVLFNGPPRRKYRVDAVAATIGGGGIELRFGSNKAGYELTPPDATTIETDDEGWLVLGAVPWSDLPTTLTATVTDIGPATDVVPEVASPAFAIRPNRDTVRGVIDSGNDHDAYLLRGRPGQAYRIVMLGSPGVGQLSAYVHAAESFGWLRALGLVEPSPGAAELWSASPRFTIPPEGGSYVLDAYAEGATTIGTPFQIRIESVCRADWNDDGHVGVSDLLDYLVDFLGEPEDAEFDHVGGPTLDDLHAFLAAYFAGCE